MRIEPGEVVVNDVHLVIDYPDVKIWEVDLASKYAEIFAFTGDGVLLRANERTLYVDKSLPGVPTALINDLNDTWVTIAECARYTCRVVAYQRTP